MTTATPGRDAMLAHLVRELVGPAPGHEESLGELPFSRYTAGILFPVGTDFAEEGAGPQGDDDLVTQSSKYYPSAAGMSFVLPALGEMTVTVGGMGYTSQDDSARDGEADTSKWKRTALPGAGRLQVRLALGETVYAALDGRANVVVRVRQAGTGYPVTVAMVNAAIAKDLKKDRRGKLSKEAVAAAALYEASMVVEPDQRPVGYGASEAGLLDSEDHELAFTYRATPSFAVGHGAAADWEDVNGTLRLHLSFVPSRLVKSVSFDTMRTRALGDTLDLGVLRSASDLRPLLQPLADAYAAWTETQSKELGEEALEGSLADVGDRVLEGQLTASERIQAGVDLLSKDELAARAFRIANDIMYRQMQRPALGERAAKHPRWRAFQLAFALVVIPSLVNPAIQEHDLVDLLWFPTGGGKTEAYLLLAAFEIARRRLVGGGEDHGVAVLSRYTLRLLTTQQFQRAVAMACAAELVRLEAGSGLGGAPIEIGLFLGKDHTPNKYLDAAQTWLPQWTSGARVLPTPDCPWCGTPIVKGPEHHGIEADEHSLVFRCIGAGCPFGRETGLPIHIVDDGVITNRPAMVIATVDKFAWIPAWNPTSAKLLGGPGGAGPTLILQDELHLLNGPLGTTAALYEVAIDKVIQASGVRPKVIASTATIRRAAEQSKAVFGRDLQLFPPNGIRPSDSFFSELDDDPRTSRVYVGVMTVGASWQTTAVNALTALAAGADTLEEAERDPYWTSVVYTNSLDDHGRVATLISDDVRSRLRQLATRGTTPRTLPEVEELRGAGDLSALTRVLHRLGRSVGEPECLDVVITTNLIQVGIDVQRLGLITFVGQPKATSEYIQASSRVGRAGDAPGLVVTLFNHARARDRSHYESFRPFHDALYRWVEPMSVTPFSTAAMERVLPAVFTTLVRHATTPAWQVDAAAGMFRAGSAVAVEAKTAIKLRAKKADPAAMSSVEREIDALENEWDEAARTPGPPLGYHDGGNERRRLVKSFSETRGLWPVQTSMRSVEEDVAAVIFDPLAPGGRP